MRSVRVGLALGALLALGATGAMLMNGEPALAPRPPRPNLILLVIDTQRADRIGAYGNPDRLTPFLDRLAAHAYVFRRAYSTASWTKPSVASLITSRYQSQHRVETFKSVLSDDEVTLPEVLHDHGYLTLGYSANLMVPKVRGFAQGYDTYEILRSTPMPSGRGFKVLPQRASALSRLVQRRLWKRTASERAAPLFLYLQFMEPHSPYAPPPGLVRERFRDRVAPDVKHGNELLTAGVPVEGSDLRLAEDLYDLSVLSLDRAFPALFAMLRRSGVLDDAIVVVTADHGQELMDHGHVGHGGSLYQELVHVPLLVVLPGHRTRTDVDEVVSLVDVAPTLLDLAGIPPPAAFAGRSLRPLLLDDPSWRNLDQLGPRLCAWWRGPRGTAFFEQLSASASHGGKGPAHQRGVVDGDRKLLIAADGSPRFYDLLQDPGERGGQANTVGEQPALQHLLDDFVARTATADAGPAPTAEIDEERARELRALGYLPEG